MWEGPGNLLQNWLTYTCHELIPRECNTQEGAHLLVRLPKFQKVIDLACALFDNKVPDPNTAILLGAKHYYTGHIMVEPTLWQEGADGGSLNLSEHRGRYMTNGQGLQHTGKRNGVIVGVCSFLFGQVGWWLIV
jgi:hypothetical protein